jgi:hypothetical protein
MSSVKYFNSINHNVAQVARRSRRPLDNGWAAMPQVIMFNTGYRGRYGTYLCVPVHDVEKLNFQWSHWDLSGSVILLLPSKSPSPTPFHLHLGWRCPVHEAAHCSRMFHFTCNLVPLLSDSAGEKVSSHLQPGCARFAR